MKPRRIARRSREDGPPGDLVELQVEPGDQAIRYLLKVRSQGRPHTVLLVIRHRDNGDVDCWIDGPALPLGGL